MSKHTEDAQEKPMNHLKKTSAHADGSPKFGRLLIVLIIAVIVLGFLTWATEAYYS